MFERAHHRRIATVLEALDATYLEANHCYFGGATAIALTHGEYRDSLDIDFLVSDPKGYRALRQRVNSKAGINGITRSRALVEARTSRIDQYGIRTMLAVADVEIKLEIVHEGRITLEPPGPLNRILGVGTLTPLDMGTTKLLANSDRWADDSVFSRDLIDLAMLGLDKLTLRRAIIKASGAYGKEIERDLQRAIRALQKRPGRLVDCMQALQMLATPPSIQPLVPAVLWKRIRALAAAKN